MPSGRHRKDSKGGKEHKRQESVENGVAEAASEAPEIEPDKGCPAPTGCLVGDDIDPDTPLDSIKVCCNNPECRMGEYLHKPCFEAWEESVMNYLRTTGRARNWSEKQRHQNLWTKKGYDLAFKACDCKCGRGHLSKDLDYVVPAAGEDAEKKKRHRKKSGGVKPAALSNIKPAGAACATSNGTAAVVPTSAPVSVNENSANGTSHYGNNCGMRGRSRTLSFSSTLSSSPPSSLPHSYGGKGSANSILSKFDPEALHQIETTGSIFHRRNSLSRFYEVLPKWERNGYHIKMEDDCPQGNDDIRCFVLTTLGDRKQTEVRCLLCQFPMPVYDKYPLVDGTLFVAGFNYANGGIQVKCDEGPRFLFAVCVECLWKSPNMVCCRCRRSQWFRGDTLQLGTMYNYDILSAFQCFCEPVCLKSANGDHCNAKFCKDAPPPNMSQDIDACSSCGRNHPKFVRDIAQLRLA